MVYKSKEGLSRAELEMALEKSLDGKKPRKVLLLPPDYTRMHSGAGLITEIYYDIFTQMGIEADVLPTLGTHDPMTREECLAFFGPKLPFEKILVHNWKTDVIKIGEVPAQYVGEVSDGLVNENVDVEVNRRIMDPSYDLIISVGQVVPHEVVGMANYSKNILVGCGGSNMINSSHMLGAFYGMERIMGKDFSPVRRVFDYAEEHFLAALPIMYVLTVTTNRGEDVFIHGLYIGRQRELFEQAVALSQEKNLTCVGPPLKKVVVNLDEREFKSTWLGNKAIYRTRMSLAVGGDLIILAPGVKKFGEDDENDRLIRKYGYVGRERVLELVKENDDLKQNLSVAAHLIHGSSDGMFNITYCTEKLGQDEVEGVNFSYMPYCKAKELYSPEILKDGFNTLENGEEIFYISNPALGLWTCQMKEG